MALGERADGLDATTTGQAAQDEVLLDARFVRGPLVARGGMGEVYKGWDRQRSRPVAVKMLLEKFGADPELRARFALEAEMLARIEHPGLVGVHARGELLGRPYFVMDWIAGRTLAELIRTYGPLPLWAVAEIGRQVADALSAVHAAGLVHRDVKPGNVMIGADGICTLLDFGVLRSEERSLTASGATLGTPEYMSPEQARNPSLADARSDLYALGITLYAALVGHPPFSGGSTYEIIHAHHQQQATAPSHLVPTLPSAVDRLIARALAKEPLQRYASGAALSAALRELSPAAPPGSLGALARGQLPSPVVTTRGPRRTRAALWILTSAAAIVSGLWIYRQDPRSNELAAPPALLAPATSTQSPSILIASPPPSAEPPPPSAEPPPPAEPPKPRPPTSTPRASPALAPSPTPTSGVLRIVTLDRGLSTYASVSVDGAPPRQAPVAEWIVPAGRRQVHVSREGYVSRTVEVELAPGERRKVEVELELAPE